MTRSSWKRPRTEQTEVLPPTKKRITDTSPRLSSSKDTTKAMAFTNTMTSRAFQQSDDERPTLIISMDYGTVTQTANFCLSIPGQDFSHADIKDIMYSAGRPKAPQRIARDQAGNYYFGLDVEKAERDAKIRSEDVITLWKLLLYRKHRSSEAGKEVEDQLHELGIDLIELISRHIAHSIDAIKSSIRHSLALEYTAEEVNQMHVKLCLSVPEMWQAPANLDMQTAAKCAGIPWVDPVYEPRCAAACYMHIFRDEILNNFISGDRIVVPDLGGGTGDFTCYEVIFDHEGQDTFRLNLVHSEGALCGSEFVNLHFIKWLKRHGDNFKARCRALRITERDCIKQAGDAFEQLKLKFTGPCANPGFVTIYGASDAVESVWVIRPTSNDIESFFAPVFQEIFECMDEMVVPRPKAIMIPGGFGNSVYLVDKMRMRYPGITIWPQCVMGIGEFQPVSRGALLLRKGGITEHGMPSGEGFGIMQNEEWRAKLHPDATFFAGERMPNGQIRRGTTFNSNLVETYACDRRKRIAPGRWCPILEKGAEKKPGEEVHTSTWQIYDAAAAEKEMDIQVYWTNRNIKRHEAMYTGRPFESPLKDGIEPFGKPLIMPLPDFEALGYPVQDNCMKGIGKTYRLFRRILLTCNGANTSIKCQIAQPGTDVWYADGEDHTRNARIIAEKTFELCAASHSPFVRVAGD